MSVCPRCGTKIAAASKIWPLQSAKKEPDQKEPQFMIGTFQCNTCKIRFNARIPTEEKTARTVNVKNKADRIMRIQGALMQTIKTLKEKIAALENEKASLMGEIETLRKTAEERVAALEAEVGQMREEANSLRTLIGSEPTIVTTPQVKSGPS